MITNKLADNHKGGCLKVSSAIVLTQKYFTNCIEVTKKREN
jgi:hypothetical protein